jgi:hypothetical protein
MKASLHRIATALFLVTAALLAGACNETPPKTPKLINDPSIQNKPGSRQAAFFYDQWFALDQDSLLTGSPWATIDANNAFITRVEVDYMDNPDGGDASVSSSDMVGVEARPMLGQSWVDNCRFSGDVSRYVTSPCTWYARLPKREGMGVGSTVQYQFQVFYKESPDATVEKNVTMGYRTVKLGPRFGRTTTTPGGASLSVGGEAVSVTITYSPAPARASKLVFYSEPDSVLQVFNEQDEPISSLDFAPNQFTQKVKVKATRASSGAYVPANPPAGVVPAIQPGTAVLWSKASGWEHGVVTVNVAP